MRTALLVLLFSAASLMAQRNDLKPGDFEPLTSLPWEKPNATLDGTLEAIYREPDAAIRYPVLAAYLETIPVEQLGKAFDKCITLECAQTPDELVAFFLQIWAQRDPETCWKRTKALFRVVGFEQGWLNYNTRKNSPRIAVRDLNAIRASRFWLDSEALTTFPLGIDQSSLPKEERLRIMREFADMWFDAFGAWPVTWGQYGPISDSRWYPSSGVDMDAFSMPADKLRDYVSASRPYDQKGGVEIAMRRWLQAEPSAAPEIVAKSREVTLRFSYGERDVRYTGPSVELLMLWAKIDQAGMVRWADPLDPKKDPVALEAKGLLMSRVDPETRKRWLADAQFPDGDGDLFDDLFTEWAGWDPVAALETAVASRNAVAIEEAGYGAAFGPFDRQPLNSSGFGLGVIKKFDIASLPPLLLDKATRRDVVYNWGCDGIMEQWGAIDIGETARYGLDFLLRTNYPSKDRLIRLFTKGDPTLGDDAMNDRTFCALRVWAVFKPKEMAAWISTLKDADLRKALTWLLNHPWGPALDS